MSNLELFVRLLPSLACVVGAVVTAVYAVDYWFLFLIAAFYLGQAGVVTSVACDEDDSSDDDESGDDHHRGVI